MGPGNGFAGCVGWVTGAVGWVFGWAAWVGLGDAGESMPAPNMFHVDPLNCGVGKSWMDSEANSFSANVFQMRAGQ